MRALALMVAVVACDAGEKPPPPEAAAAKPIAKPAAASPTAFALDYVPADADLVGHVDVAVLRRSKIWLKHEPDVAKALAESFGVCAQDPLRPVTSLTFGWRLDTELGVYVVRGLDRDTTLACMRQHRQPKLAIDGDVVTYTATTAAAVMKFVDDKTLVIQGGKQVTKQTLGAVLQGGAPLAKDAQLVAAIAAARKAGVQASALTLVSRPGSTAFQEKTAIMGKLLQLSATARLVDRLDIRIAVDFGSEGDATQFADLMKNQMASLKSMFDRVDSAAQGKSATLDFGMTEAQLESMIGVMRGMSSAN